MKEQLKKFPKINLINLPTPLEFAGNLTRKLNGPQLFFKRDDETGLAFGGNKSRKLEYILPEAVDRQSDVLITFGSIGSNHTRLTAAAARKLGMDSVLVMCGNKPNEIQGNLRIEQVLGAEIRLIDEDPSDFFKRNTASPGLVETILHDIVEEKLKEGRKPFIVPPAGFCPLGAISYANAAMEMVMQMAALGRRIDAVVVAAGSGGTYAGLSLGVKALSPHTQVIGGEISGIRSLPALTERVVDIADQAASALGIDTRLEAANVELYDCSGEGYPIPSSEGYKAMTLTAESEGILLDASYTAKTMACFIDLIAKKRFKSNETIVFVHTGGAPALFSDTTLIENLPKNGISIINA